MNAKYQELLNTDEWRKKRHSILKRDGFICQKCNNQKIKDRTSLGKIIYPGRQSLEYNNHYGEYLANSIYHSTIEDIKTKDQFTVFITVVSSNTELNSKCQIYFSKNEVSNEKTYANVHLIECLVENDITSSILNVDLEVHHKYYKLDKKPWDYPDEALISLCHECHIDVHQTTEIKIFREDKSILLVKPCPRCFGSGYLMEYKHVQRGICFGCWGARYFEI